jgi:hypothetical protein
MSEGEPKNRHEQRAQTMEAIDRIYQLCKMIPYTAHDVKNAKTKGIKPEKKLAILKEIQEIIGTTSEQIFALLDKENIPKTVSGFIRDSMKNG